MREIKFRAWDKLSKRMIDDILHIKEQNHNNFGNVLKDSTKIVMQYTGLKDKKNLQEVYEGDIIDTEGNIKGNIYEMDKGKTDFVIQGFGTKTWCETYRRAILLGLKDAE